MQSNNVKYFFILILSSCLLMLLTISLNSPCQQRPETTKKDTETKKKLILLYTKYLDHIVHKHDNYTTACGCDFTRCEYTFNGSKLSESDAVIFQAERMPFYINLDYLNVIRTKLNKNQMWIYFAVNNLGDVRAGRSLHTHDKYFNWSISYRLNSDIRRPFAEIKKLKKTKTLTDTNYAENKTKQVAWIVNKCGELRDDLAMKLGKYGITIDIHGRCQDKNNNTNFLRCRSVTCEKELRKYKFYFAAEERLCKDFITGEYWQKPFNGNAIPIVLGGADYSNSRLAIPGSFLDALKFKTPKALADYIKELDKDDKKYNEYFKWKSRWERIEEKKGCPKFMCELCNKLHESSSLAKPIPLKDQINTQECNKTEGVFYKWIKT